MKQLRTVAMKLTTPHMGSFFVIYLLVRLNCTIFVGAYAKEQV